MRFLWWLAKGQWATLLGGMAFGIIWMSTQAVMPAAPVPDPVLQARRQRIVLSGDVPSPANPPCGCRFHTRWWNAQPICSTDHPPLIMRGEDVAAHPTACHFAEEMVEVVTG